MGSVALAPSRSERPTIRVPTRVAHRDESPVTPDRTEGNGKPQQTIALDRPSSVTRASATAGQACSPRDCAPAAIVAHRTAVMARPRRTSGAAVHAVHAGACGSLANLPDLGVLVAAVPSERGFPRRKLQHDGATSRRLSFQNFHLATTNEVLAACGKNALGPLGLVLVVADRVENLTLIDHVGHHRPSEVIRWAA